MVHELADEAAGRGADGDGGEQRRRRQADEHADAAAPAEALAAEVVAGLADVDLAVRVALDEDHALGPDLLLLDERTSASKSFSAASTAGYAAMITS